MNRILNEEMLTNHGNLKGRRDAYEIMEAGLKAGDPYYNTKTIFRIEGNTLYAGGDKMFEPTNDPQSGVSEYDLSGVDRIFVVGAGKGVQRVALALEEVLGDHLTGGHVIGKHGDDVVCTKIGVTLGSHPTPDKYCVEGCQKIYDLAKASNITEKDLVITIAANGISSLLTLPVDGVTIDEVREMTYMMQIEKGVPTRDLNPIRNQIDKLKGGRLSRIFQPARMIHLVVIDANQSSNAGHRSDYDYLLANNRWLHNLCDGTSFTGARASMTKWDGWDRCPKSIVNHLKNEEKPENETVRRAEFEATDFRIFGVMPDAISVWETALKKAGELGYNPIYFNSWCQVEAADSGAMVAQIARTCESYKTPFKGPTALISKGEMLVTVGDQKGVGGRNQEYCVAAIKWLDGSEKVVMAGADTDGTDGPGGFDKVMSGVPECLAGGIVDGYTFKEAAEKGVDLIEALKTHGTSEALWKLGSGISAEHNISICDLNVTLIME